MQWRRTMKAYLLGAVIAAAGGVWADGPAGQPYLGQDVGDVVVAAVKKVSDHAATNGDPPRLELEVHEVLRGDPKADRARAVWDPRPNGFDYGDPEMMRRAVRKWEAQPLAGPKVGDKLVLWGELAGDKKRPVFHAYSWHAYPFSAEKRTWAVKVIRDAEEAARRYAAKLEAEKKALAKAQAEWRAKTSADDLKKYAAQADVVAVGRICSEYVSGPITIRVGQLLKGEKRKGYKGDDYYVGLTVPKKIRELLDRETDYLLFLSADGLEAGPAAVSYPLIKAGAGIVIADRKAVDAVKEALGRK